MTSEPDVKIEVFANKAFIVPFDDPLNPVSTLAWVYWNGNRSLYSAGLIAILKYKGYIIIDMRKKTDINVVKFEEF